MLAQAEDYCGDYNKRNVYEDAYCNLRVEGNTESEDLIRKKVAKQLGYDEGLVDLMLERGQALTCGDIKVYVEENGLDIITELHEDIKRPCVDRATNKFKGTDFKEYSRTLERLKNAYLKEYNLHMNQERLKQTFKASERYWDSQLEAGTPFDLMVDLNVIDTMLFGSQSQWVNDSFGFSKGKDPDENNNDLPPFEPDDQDQQLNEQQENNQQQQLQQNQGGNLNMQNEFIHPDCFNLAPQAPPLCGNGIVDVLAGEACDDGNKVDGDGCSNTCQPTAGSLQCKDPNAVTLQQFKALPLGEGNNPLCPPNVLAQIEQMAQEDHLGNLPDDLQPNPDPDQPQPAAEPFVGGTLSPIPVLETPACPAGQSLVKVGVGLGDQGKEVSTCIPTEFCGDFSAIRTALFGEGWESSENADIAASIETAICVNFTTANRPTTPYATNEGCIDCHFRAMADALEEALQTNVTPLVNTTTAFGLSNRWGPNFSFDLNIMVKRAAATADTAIDKKKKSKEPTTEEKTEDKETDETANQGIDQGDDAVKTGESSRPQQFTPTEGLTEEVSNFNERLSSISQNLENYQALANSSSDIAFSNQVIPQIAYLKGSFEAIQSSVNTMANLAEELATKEVCEL